MIKDIIINISNSVPFLFNNEFDESDKYDELFL